MKSLRNLLLMLAVAVVFAGSADAAHVRDFARRPFAANVIVPQSRVLHHQRRSSIEITGVDVSVKILQQAATTKMEISIKNNSRSRQEAELIVPVPEGAVVKGFTFHGSAGEAVAQVLPKDEARRIYDGIVSKMRDPALLEFIGFNLVRSSVFPVEPNSTQKVQLIYEHLLPASGDRIDYVLPRSESLEYNIPWKISVTINSKRPISTIYSPTHELITKHIAGDSKAVKVILKESKSTAPGPFLLSYLLERNGVTASLFAYPDPKIGGGYFLLLAGLPAELPKQDGAPAIKREVTLVLDRSGSMNGEKINQVREAAMQILAALEEGEAFNIIVYNEAVDFFSKEPVFKNENNIESARKYLKGIKASGGTNIHDALVEALRQKPSEEMLPIVLFLTDGLPTVGQTSEVAIRNVAIKGNPHNRRIFTFGVGVDVNTPLLDKIATETRATPTYVLPNEDVEVKVAQVFGRLAGPVLADPALRIVDQLKKSAPGRVRDMIPSKLPDMFEGDQLVLLGQYISEDPLNFVLSGNYLGNQRTFEFSFGLDDATTKNSFVPRLWASRKIGVLIDAIRQHGANGGPGGSTSITDPKLKELVDEIVRLSTEFGILTEYTAFLAREGTDLADDFGVLREANELFSRRAMKGRSGLDAVNQSYNLGFYKKQAALNPSNAFFDEKMKRVSITNVQQINDLAFYHRGGRWVDSRVVNNEKAAKPSRSVQFGSDEFRALVTKLVEQNRQGSVSLRGDILMVIDGETILIKGFEEK